MFLLAWGTCDWEQPHFLATSACDILGPQLSIWVTFTLSPKVISFLFFYSVLVGIATKDVAQLFINSGKRDRNIQKTIFIEYSKLYNNKELAKMLTKNIKAQSTTITSSHASICGSDAGPNIRHIGSWRDFQLKLPFVTTDRQSMFFVVFYHKFMGQYVMWHDYFMQIPKICHNGLYNYVITFILGWMGNGLVFQNFMQIPIIYDWPKHN